MRPAEHESGGMPLLEAGASGMPGASAHAMEHPLSMARRMLRGRWRLAGALAGALAVAGAVVGYSMSKPKFTASGMLEVQPNPQPLLPGGRSDGPQQNIEQFVTTQATFLSSAPVITGAVMDGGLREMGWPAGAEGIALLQDRLKVVSGRGQTVIVVRVDHERPPLAQKAVNATLKAYAERHGDQAGINVTKRERQVEEILREQQNELTQLRNEMTLMTDQYGVEGLDRPYQAKLDQFQRLQDQIADLTLAIARKEAKAATTASETTKDAAAGVDVQQLALADGSLMGMLTRKDALEADYRSKSTRYGPRHNLMRDLRHQLDLVSGEIDTRVQQLLAGATPMGSGGQASGATPVDLPLDELKAQKERLTQVKNSLSAELQDVGRRRSAVQAKATEVAAAEERIAGTRSALEGLRAEGKNATGRVKIWEADLPMQPEKDRRAARAFAGMIGGGLAGVAVVFLLGLLSRSYRYIEDLEHGPISAPLLGTLPELTSGDGEHDEVAAGSVHHVRNMMQLQPTRQTAPGAVVYSVTSASASEGKTSLTMALGMSFGAAGHRTLLIDADLFGRGLTKSLGMGGMPGLAEAALTRSLNGEVHETGFPNVMAIPAGKRQDFDAQNLSKPRMADLLERARRDFDVVLVDTGPLLGSIEANLAAALADGVALVITRGQDSKLVRMCLKRITSVGGLCIGLVFNRAIRQDFERSVQSSFRSTRSTPLPTERQIEASSVRESSLMRALEGSGGSESRAS